ncbi:hypothetical protein EAH88_03260 [Rhodanobacter glycinis]|uniref:DUF4261 domain-containing protein n=1 Tax=Rhodanobacter glycinis TaxID=582702 RepID=A0A502CFH6_9GAMM|nr:hypothetical protein [Rhodanobacter glycinis]TPG11543.1 hypothetical protein EAH88_03260 [Rhodanobacter glycinis]
MSNPITIPAWQRPHWQASDEEVLLQFYVFGKFDAVRVPSADYGSPGLPAGIEAVSHYHSALRQWEGYPLKGAMGRMFKADAPEAWQLAFDAPEVMVVRGTLKDSPATGYLRDTLGVLAGMLDIGGTAILDPQILSLLDADAWRRKYLIRDGAPIRNHLLILRDGEPTPDHSWIHTRGMRKFGRPDISIRQVPDRAVDRAGLLCEKLVELEALGAHFSEGQRLDIEGVPSGVVVHLGGGLDDPQFNNTYVEFNWSA